MRNSIETLEDLTALGRVRLSRNFFMRDMLASEVSNFYGVPNIPETPALAIEAGRKLCEHVLEPLCEAFGHIAIRSAYRSPTLNDYCHQRFLAGDKAAWCTCNEANAAHHIWDCRDKAGFLGATATIVIPHYLDYYEKTGDWQSLAWWMHDHVPGFAEVQFFRHLCAVNIRWYEGPNIRSVGYLDPPHREVLTQAGHSNSDREHRETYREVAALRDLLPRNH